MHASMLAQVRHLFDKRMDLSLSMLNPKYKNQCCATGLLDVFSQNISKILYLVKPENILKNLHPCKMDLDFWDCIRRKYGTCILPRTSIVHLDNNYRLLNVYCEIFGTSSYGEGRTSLRVRLRHMNECRIFHNIHSTTFLLYTFYINFLVSSVQST